LKLILLFFGERNNSNELSFKSAKVSSDDADWDPESLSEGFEFAHLFFHIHLDNSSSLKNVGAFVKLNVLGLILLPDISFFDDWDWFSSQSAFINECGSLKDDSFEREFDGIFEKNNVARNYINGWNLNYGFIPEDIEWDIVVSHVKYLFIELLDLVQVNAYRYWRCKENDSCIVIILFIGPKGDAENDK
jgi:hypothetical protein